MMGSNREPFVANDEVGTLMERATRRASECLATGPSTSGPSASTDIDQRVASRRSFGGSFTCPAISSRAVRKLKVRSHSTARL
jgi:hypothetical protein